MTESQKAPQIEEGPSRRASRGTPLVFISHDSRDAEVAEAFSKLLSSVSAGVLKSFRSSDRKGSQGIEYGVEWYPELMKKLELASDVVCLLTPRSLDRPWILYEAGVAKGKLDTPVYGIAVGIPLNRANAGPFAQFQNCDDKETSLTKLVMQLLARVPDSEPDREAVQMQVKSFKDKLDLILKQADGADDAGTAEGQGDTASVAKLFEEIKVMFQDMPSRVEARLVEGGVPFRRRRPRRFHPMMFEELSHMVSDDPGDPVGLLMMASTIRDDVPWLYELIVDAYREAKAGNSSAARDALHRARRAGKVIMGGPWMEEMGVHPRELEILFMELPMLLDRYLSNFEEKAVKRPGKGKALESSA